MFERLSRIKLRIKLGAMRSYSYGIVMLAVLACKSLTPTSSLEASRTDEDLKHDRFQQACEQQQGQYLQREPTSRSSGISCSCMVLLENVALETWREGRHLFSRPCNAQSFTDQESSKKFFSECTAVGGVAENGYVEKDLQTTSKEPVNSDAAKKKTTAKPTLTDPNPEEYDRKNEDDRYEEVSRCNCGGNAIEQQSWIEKGGMASAAPGLLSVWCRRPELANEPIGEWPEAYAEEYQQMQRIEAQKRNQTSNPQDLQDPLQRQSQQQNNPQDQILQDPLSNQSRQQTDKVLVNPQTVEEKRRTAAAYQGEYCVDFVHDGICGVVTCDGNNWPCRYSRTSSAQAWNNNCVNYCNAWYGSMPRWRVK